MLSKKELKVIVLPLVPEPEHRFTNTEMIYVPPGTELLGSGSSGAVFKINEYVIKRITDPTDEINNELIAWDKFSSNPILNPYIPKYYGHTIIKNENATNDNYEDKSYLFIVQKYEPAVDLFSFIKNKILPFERGYPLFLNICKGFDAIHKAGYIHRDIKSLNILIRTEEEKKTVWKRFTTSKKEYNPQPIIIDFGSVCKLPCDCRSLQFSSTAYLANNIIPFNERSIINTVNFPVTKKRERTFFSRAMNIIPSICKTRHATRNKSVNKSVKVKLTNKMVDPIFNIATDNYALSVVLTELFKAIDWSKNSKEKEEATNIILKYKSQIIPFLAANVARHLPLSTVKYH